MCPLWLSADAPEGNAPLRDSSVPRSEALPSASDRNATSLDSCVQVRRRPIDPLVAMSNPSTVHGPDCRNATPATPLGIPPELLIGNIGHTSPMRHKRTRNPPTERSAVRGAEWRTPDGLPRSVAVAAVGSIPTMEPQVDDAINPAAADEVLELERELCRLPDVSAARVVTDDIGRPTEVHILANGPKHPKQVVRDVQSVALASFGIELDRRIVSVVRLHDGDEPTAAAAPTATDVPDRLVLVHVTSEINGLRNLVRVTLGRGEERAVGFAEGSVAASARHRLVAAATVDSLRQIHAAAECIDVDSAQIVRVGVHDVAIVTVVFVVPPTEQMVSGSAIVREHQESDAVVRAVLDATNRRLSSF